MNLPKKFACDWKGKVINMSIRVMIADDHNLIREGLKQLLEFDGSIKVVGEACDGEECLEKIEALFE